ncbi:unnamed protein product [Ectocarpus sp. 12 AP-2014]
MKNQTLIRPIVRADLPALKRVIASTDLFPPDMLEGMMDGHLNGASDAVLWLTFANPDPVAIAYVRVLLVETSGNAGFARTRAFYAQAGYEEEARIREFYAAGEDKIIFRKAL